MADIDPYYSHRWKTMFQPIEGIASPVEAVCYCMDCGCENMGDPAEFPELKYPQCERSAEQGG